MHHDDHIDKELQFHVDQRVADYVASGLTPAEARRRAALEFGGVAQTKEAIRDQASWRVLESVLRDVGFAIRSLRRTPVFALTAAVVLGLRIGASLTNMPQGVVLRSLHDGFAAPVRPALQAPCSPSVWSS
jgi:hypothetical protein